MAKINIRSPYFVTISESELSSVTMELYVYRGTRFTGQPPQPAFTLISSAIDEEVTFEISELVKDYLDVTFDGDYDSQMVWVDYQTKRYYFDGYTYLDTVVSLEGFDGYGYFEDGVQNQSTSINESALMMSNTIIYNLDNEDYLIPINTSLSDYVELYDGDVLIKTITTPLSNDSYSRVDYLRGVTNITGSYQDRVIDDNGIIESLNCVSSEFSDISKFDKAIIYDLLGESITVNVENISECKHTPHKITFINKFGVLQDIWFFKRSKLALKTKKEDYKANIINSGSYSINSHQNRLLRKQGTEKLTLNSGFVNEEYNEVFRQLMLSEKVWVNYDGKTLPINISSSSLDYKTSLNDRLINYTIDVDFAFDKINNIR